MKQIPGYEDYYATKEGKIISMRKQPANPIGKPKELKLIKHRDGYQIVCLYPGKKYISVHRLMMLTYNPIKDKKMEVNHTDGNKTNNDIGNLEWVTKSENIKHAYKTGLMRNRAVQIKQYTLSGDFIAEHNSIRDAAKAVNKKFSSLRGRETDEEGYIKACNYKWRYENQRNVINR